MAASVAVLARFSLWEAPWGRLSELGTRYIFRVMELRLAHSLNAGNNNLNIENLIEAHVLLVLVSQFNRRCMQLAFKPICLANRHLRSMLPSVPNKLERNVHFSKLNML